MRTPRAVRRAAVDSGAGGAADEREGAVAEGIGRGRVVADEARPQGGARVVHAQLQAQRRRTGRGAVLDAELERGVGPRRRRYRLVSPKACRSLEPRRPWPATPPAGALRVWWTRRIAQLRGARQGAQAVEDDGHLGGGVFVGAVQADEGIEDEQARGRPRDGGGEPIEAVGQADAGLDDHLDGQRGERLRRGPSARAARRWTTTAGGSSAAQSSTGPGAATAKRPAAAVAEATATASSRAKKLLPVFGRAAEDAGGADEEEVGEQPAQRRGGIAELRRGQRAIRRGRLRRVHRRRRRLARRRRRRACGWRARRRAGRRWRGG